MIPLRIGHIAKVTGGSLAGGLAPETLIDGPVEFDSRLCKSGGLFVALQGERVDGHDFARHATQAGAAATLAARPVDGPAVVVDDVVEALGAIARDVLGQLPKLTVVGLTGSSGKTSTKDLIGQILPPVGPTVATHGSYNNEFSLPITALRVDHQTRHLVLEMGARGRGHISYLSGIAPPKIGVVLNVGMAHVGGFGSLDDTARAKAELVESLPSDGIAVLNADDPRVMAMAEKTSARIVTFGLSEDADVRATDVELDERGRARFELHVPAPELFWLARCVVEGSSLTARNNAMASQNSARIALQLVGEHHVSNALAAAATALVVGAPLSTIADELGRAVPVSPGRMQVTERPDGVTIVNDAYNANPDSMRAGLEALGHIVGTSTTDRPRRSWAVLGYMAELGSETREAHKHVGRFAAECGVDRLVVVGEKAASIVDGAQSLRGWAGIAHAVPDVDTAITTVKANLKPGDVVFVKASLSAGLQVVAQALMSGQEKM